MAACVCGTPQCGVSCSVFGACVVVYGLRVLYGVFPFDCLRLCNPLCAVFVLVFVGSQLVLCMLHRSLSAYAGVLVRAMCC